MPNPTEHPYARGPARPGGTAGLINVESATPWPGIGLSTDLESGATKVPPYDARSGSVLARSEPPLAKQHTTGSSGLGGGGYLDPSMATLSLQPHEDVVTPLWAPGRQVSDVDKLMGNFLASAEDRTSGNHKL